MENLGSDNTYSNRFAPSGSSTLISPTVAPAAFSGTEELRSERRSEAHLYQRWTG